MAVILGLIGGLGLFIYGMHLMSEGLKLVAGNKMRSLLEKLTNTPLKALLCGIIVTIMVQSSSTTTVMVVGFVNASIMTLTQAAGIILGSNIGTTVMAQIIALDITDYAAVFIGVGAIIYLFAKRKKQKDWGSIILGFGLLFFGISTMSGSMAPLGESQEFIDILLTYGKNPILGLLVSTIMTGILQSSGAIIGLVQALAISGVFASTSGTEAIEICIPLIIGSNIGTCVTALLSSLGTSRAAKGAACIHLFVNIFGAIWVMAILYGLGMFIPMTPVYQWIVNISGTTILNGQVVPNVARQIAMAHMLFNVANTIVLFPFLNSIVRFVERILPPEHSEDMIHVDSRLLSTPAIAIGQAKTELVKMSHIVAKNFSRGIDSLITLDEGVVERVKEVENRVDDFEKTLQEYCVKILDTNITLAENETVSYMIEDAHALETIGDYAENLTSYAESMSEKGLTFSDGMIKALEEIRGQANKILDDVTDVLKDPTPKAAERVFRLENKIEVSADRQRSRRINKMYGKDESKIYPTFVFVDILRILERVGELSHEIASRALDEKLGEPESKIGYIGEKSVET